MNEELIKEIDLAGVKYTDIANIIGVKPNHFYHYIRGKLSDEEIAKIRNALYSLIENNKTDEYAAYLQDKLKQECSDFLLLTCMNTVDFCKKIKISTEAYYKWQKGVYGPSDDTQYRIRKYLYSKRAQDLLTKRKLYRPISDCASITGLKPNKIRNLCNSGAVSFERNGRGHFYVNIEDLNTYAAKRTHAVNSDGLAFGELSLDPNENLRPLLSTHNDYEIFDESRYEYVHQYWVSDKGRIFNATTRKLLSSEKDGSGYIQVHLQKSATQQDFEYLHRLVAYLFCPNCHYKEFVHHIDGNKQNNRASNLIWVTREEHRECHSLMRKSKKEYNSYIKKLRKDNRWKG